MKTLQKIICIAALGIAVYAGYAAYRRINQQNIAYQQTAPPATQQIPEPPVPSSAQQLPGQEIHICSFNLQAFGPAKAAKPAVIKTLTEIVSECDITAVQEIRDVSNTAFPSFMGKLNGTKAYQSAEGPRLGPSVSKEQYAFIYDPLKVTLLGNYTFNDSQDIFDREPFMAYFSAGQFKFVLVNIHTKPEDATEEICSLDKVVDEAKAQFNENKVYVGGDFNADGTYFSEEKVSCPFRTSPQFKWLIGDEEDTTLAVKENTYDRFVSTPEAYAYFVSAGVYRYDLKFGISPALAKEVSDHYPISMTLALPGN